MESKKIENNSVTNFYIGLEDVSDSLLLSSSRVVADYVDKTNNVYLSLEVRGEVHVTYKERDYYDVRDFPEELKSIIKDGYDEDGMHHSYSDHPDISVLENNWFELFEIDAHDNYLGRALVVDAENYTQEDIESLFKETAEEILEERETYKTDDEREI